MTSLLRELVAGIVSVAIVLLTVWSIGALLGVARLGYCMVGGC